jgi:transketolase
MAADTKTKSLDQLAINTIRMLAIEMVEKANSGHPGMPMGAAPMAYVLWTRFMKHNPANPNWFNRDRFVLSAGHGSALLYSLLHLSGYDVSMEELKQFRQWGSKTPGHPEFGHTPGVEATTGPLGQGIAMAVGMAMAEAHLAATYNTETHKVVDHYTYVICGDGDLMEGVSAEASSMAGHLQLGKLIVLYDSNDISLDGETSFAFTEHVQKRYEAYGWQYLRVEDGNDLEAIADAIRQAQADTKRPSLIEVKTTIGFGSPNKGGKSASHGAPLGRDEIELVRQAYGWDYEPFHVPEEVYQQFAQVKAAGQAAEDEWKERVEALKQADPDLANQFLLAIEGKLPDGWDADLPVYSAEDNKKIATRQASGTALNAIAKRLPWLIGGSADLQSSNNTNMKGFGVFHAEDFRGRNIWFGVREHAMGAALNGMALHGGVKVFGATFFVFSDYLRPAIRLSALMKQPVIYIFTHDSIAVGEDGPTHEPIEHLPALRVIPGMTVLRPADANETTEAWRYAVQNEDGPVALILTRQGLPVLPNTETLAKEWFAKGAYVLADAGSSPDVVLLASGSEVSLAMQAREKLAEQGIAARVVSMPSWELFDKQPQEYRDSVLPPHVKARVAIEMAHPLGWEKYVGEQGAVIGIQSFGASAPGEIVMREFGFTVEHVVDTVKRVLQR